MERAQSGQATLVVACLNDDLTRRAPNLKSRDAAHKSLFGENLFSGRYFRKTVKLQSKLVSWERRN
jgi:hypothetical protein